MDPRPDSSSRRTLGQLVRLAVCGLLLAVIFHAIFCNEAQIDLLAQGKPEAWNAIVKRDLGLDVPDDRRGVLQDIHWSTCQIGTFCNYTIGNVMAAQLFETARAKDPSIVTGLAIGNYTPLNAYLGKHIHQHGRRFTRDELLVKATGRPLEAGSYLRYLKGKVADVYGVSF